MSRFRSVLPWLVPPTLAIIAFFPVIGMWFVADDFGHLLYNNRLPFPQPLFAFTDNALFYRPFSTILTWNLGTALFGREAMPYHVVSLLLHALGAFLLARLVYIISGSKASGVLAGSLFAVFPLITEPVAWLASQWDVLGIVCLLGAAIGFAVAWRNKLDGRSVRLPYALGLVSAFLAVGMKESTLPLPAVLPFVALALYVAREEKKGTPTTLAARAQAFARSILWAIPYAAPSALFVALRLIGSGNIGGYANAPTDIQHFFWDTLSRSFLVMLMPLNRAIFSETTVQVVGLVATISFFGMLIVWGKQKWAMLLLALVWWVVFIAPVLNLLTGAENPSNISNRLYYLSTAGFCIGVATLFSVPLEWPQTRAQQRASALAGALLLVMILATWRQLEPWTQASRQSRGIVEDLTAILPPKNDGFIELNTHSLPREYNGAYVFWNGLDTALQVFMKQHARVVEANGLSAQSLAEPLDGITARWNIDFTFDPASELFPVDGISGMAANGDPPDTPGTKLWDFRGCDADDLMLAGWQTTNLDAACDQGALVITPTNSDPNMLAPDVDLDTAGAKWVRIGVAARYYITGAPHLAEWYWTGPDKQLSEQNSTRSYISNHGEWQVYWTFVKAEKVGATLGSLRFDPVNDKVNAAIGWIAVAPVGK